MVSPREKKQVVKLPWDLPLRIDITEYIGQNIWLYGLFDLPECEVLFRILGPGDIAVDVGANIGQMTNLMAYRVGAQGKVFAFEPQPDIFEELRFNMNLLAHQAQRAANIVLHDYAVGDSNGESHLEWNQDFQSNRGLARLGNTSKAGIAVQTVTLDKMFAGQRITLLKIDVEGLEDKVLQGAESLLKDRRIQHIVYEDRGGVGSAVHERLRGLGYTLYEINFWADAFPLLKTLQSAEANNYLATLDPAAVESKFQEARWRVLNP